MAPSPFFKGTSLQFAWDQTSLGLLMECPRKYQLRILLGYSPRGWSLHLKFGGHFATAMEQFHKLRALGTSYDDALDLVVRQALIDTWDHDVHEGERIAETGQPWDSGDTKKSRFTLIRSIIWYFETYREDAMKTVILPDGSPAVELLFSFDSGIESPFGEFIFTGHIDRLVDFDGTMFVQDQKTTGGALGAYYFSQFDTDNQVFQYTMAGKVCYNLPIKGVVIDAAQIMVGFTAFGRGFTMRTSAQLEEWHGNASEWLDMAVKYAAAAAKNPEYQYPMNLKSCGNYGGCAFRQVCGSDPSIRPALLETHFEKRFWNPLETR